MSKKVTVYLLVLSMILSLSLVPLSSGARAASSTSINRANNLYTLGLFKGTGTNSDGTPVFDLDRAPTRAEAIVMLVRILGKENAAKAGVWSIPFEDVENWARPYVGYAYANGLSKGKDNVSFGSNDLISVSEFLTLILRALGYSSSSDFNWDSAWTYSDSIGLTDGSYNGSSNFLRGDAAIISYNALSQKLKGGNKTLLAFLFDNGAVSSKSISAVGLDSLLDSLLDSQSAPVSPDPTDGTGINPVKSGLSAEDIYAKCSPAVFHIDMYDENGKAFALGSGFFISGSGMAVTNFHMIDGAYSEKVRTSDGNTYDVLGVYDVNVSSDLALIQVGGSNFPHLNIGDSDAIKTGDTVYALGNPKGLDLSFSQGLVSNKERILIDAGFIQISVPISHGSSGGALLDSEGNAIGVTQGGSDGESDQNLNFAVPINELNKLSKASYTPLSSGYTGKFQGYQQNPLVPDFGMAVGIRPVYYDSGSNYFHYFYPFTKPFGISKYGEALKKFGYKFMCSEAPSGSSYPNGSFYQKDNSRLLIKTSTVKNVQFYDLMIINLDSVYPKKETPYKEFTALPDFGAYFGVTPTKTITSETNFKSYYYSFDTLMETEPAAISLYCKNLEYAGFAFYKDFVAESDGDSYSGYIYRKGKVNVYVGMNGDNTVLIKACPSGLVLGYEKYLSVPDFGLLIGVDIFKNETDEDGWDNYVYSAKAVLDASTASIGYFMLTLENWGYRLYREEGDLYYYTNGTYIIAFTNINLSSRFFYLGIRTVN